MNKKVAAFVPVKENSSRVSNKNTRILDGEYLFKRKLKQLLECEEIDEVWLDSESEYIHNLAKDLPIKHLYRDPSLSDNKTDGHALFFNQSKSTNSYITVQVLCTSPFLDKKVIDPAIRELKKSEKDSIVGVREEKLYLWDKNTPVYGEDIPNSFDLDSHIIECMSFYAVKTKGSSYKKRYTEDPILYKLSKIESMDINDEEDLHFCEIICAGMRTKKINRMKILSKMISSCMISDICKEKQISHFLGPKIKCLNSKTFLGYAKTLKIKSLEDSQKDPNKKEWEGIFKALESYKFIESGDVIVVSTDVKDKAYFGDLNAHFAYRNGAVGVVVDGHTRDVDRVSDIGLPIFAHGRISDDVRYEGTLESMNEPININDVNIRNNDIIFGDPDGVVCVPSERWDEVLDELKKVMKKEMLVKFEATFDSDPLEILKNIGNF